MLRKLDNNIIIKNDGKTNPKVEQRAPKNPETLYPPKVAILTDIGPGY